MRIALREDGLCSGCVMAKEREEAIAAPRSFDVFMSNVRASLDQHAERKGYSNGGANGENKLADFMNFLGAHQQHAVGEIIFKCVESLRSPRRVLFEKIAAWAFMAWRYLPNDKS